MGENEEEEEEKEDRVSEGEGKKKEEGETIEKALAQDRAWLLRFSFPGCSAARGPASVLRTLLRDGLKKGGATTGASKGFDAFSRRGADGLASVSFCLFFSLLLQVGVISLSLSRSLALKNVLR